MSENHNIYTVESNKIGLSCADDKRFLLPDGINSVPYGHYQHEWIMAVDENMDNPDYWLNTDDELQRLLRGVDVLSA